MPQPASGGWKRPSSNRTPLMVPVSGFRYFRPQVPGYWADNVVNNNVPSSSHGNSIGSSFSSSATWIKLRKNVRSEQFSMFADVAEFAPRTWAKCAVDRGKFLVPVVKVWNAYCFRHLQISIDLPTSLMRKEFVRKHRINLIYIWKSIKFSTVSYKNILKNIKFITFCNKLRVSFKF